MEEFQCPIFHPEKCTNENNITGAMLRDLTRDRLIGMGIGELDDQLKILDSIRKLWETQGKVFNDPIHGHIELHPLLVKIIDTPQFQRLRYLKQLGGAYYVYPGASHNRFEHSIGVGHLAGQLAEALRTRQPELLITARDILCVQIAGLCHDLGHGPFSHMFDNIFIAKTRPEKKWEHEEASCDMFDHLVKRNKLEPVMRKYDLKLPEDLIFIKEMIAGPLKPNTAEGQWPYEGRPEDKSFLYDIVANKRNGIDVDKFDYFARDCYHLGMQNNFDHGRFIKFARVCEVDGLKQICTRDKEQDNMYEMFHTRMCLHRRAYQHKVNKIIETMITEAFLKADKHILIEGSGGKMFTLSTAIDDMEAYTKLTDHVFEKILNSSDKTLAEARDILQRIVSRNFYKFLGEIEKPTEVCTTNVITINNWKKELAQALPERNGALTPEDFEVLFITLNYGKKDKDPIKDLHFYSKYDTTKAFKMKVSRFRPMRFYEQSIRFYCKKTDDSTLVADQRCFDEWCTGKRFSKVSGRVEDGDQN
ncbi:deoxynucleoside triphosphate triphosphohydrolase SAMHD1-like [Enoplosus armatus]|uniref:deoxynucleoside triphosphate triphosphohydrolase SAMHD1-like n=1 Tax=Enoplosus armatus TaxID=215367 RepID=UPI0039962C68